MRTQTVYGRFQLIIFIRGKIKQQQSTQPTEAQKNARAKSIQFMNIFYTISCVQIESSREA